MDLRVEVASVLARLAGYEGYGVRGIPAYDSAVAAYFGRFRDDPSVAAARRLREERDIGYNAPLQVAILAESGTWRSLVPLDPLPPWLDRRWDSRSAGEFLRALARFDSVTGATAFFAGQDSVHRVMAGKLADVLRGWMDLDWFDSEFGLPPRARFVVVPGLQTGPHNYGMHVSLPDGTVEYYQVIGTPTADARGNVDYPAREVRSLYVHELSHPFVNPWVDAHAEAFGDGGRALFSVARDGVSDAYDRWESVLYESVVRAATLRYFADHHDSTLQRLSLHTDREQGFLWTDELADAMVAVSRTRSRLDASAPAIVGFLRGWQRDASARLTMERQRIAAQEASASARGPQIVRLVPADGDTSVAPGAAVLEVHFDRPMTGTARVNGALPGVTARPSWDADKRVLRIPIVLTSGTRYELSLNDAHAPDEGFRSQSGELLYPRSWSFRVR